MDQGKNECDVFEWYESFYLNDINVVDSLIDARKF